MGTLTEEEEYAAFLENVARTIYVDNLSPQVTDAVLKAAFNQFGDVRSVQFIPNYFEPNEVPQAALVEMEYTKQARDIIDEMGRYPLMILGMPRPARARSAKLEMFDDRPRKPGRQIVCSWLYPEDPDFEVAEKIKHLVRRHAEEASLVLEQQRAEEEKLANQQNEMLKAQYKKFEQLDGVFEDGTAKHLGRHYNVSVPDGGWNSSSS